MRKFFSNVFTLILLGLAAGLAYSLFAAPAEGDEEAAATEAGQDVAVEPGAVAAAPQVAQPSSTAEPQSVAGLAVAVAGPDDVDINQANQFVGPEVAVEPEPPSSISDGNASPAETVAAGDASQSEADERSGPPVADPLVDDGRPTTTSAATPPSAPTLTGADASSAPSSTSVVPLPAETVEGSLLTELEIEILRLTNEIRTNPNGPFGRQGDFIDCGGRIAVDRANREYIPVPALTVHEEASVRVARAWSQQLTTDLDHRPQAGAGALTSIGLDVVWAGENVSFNNFDDVVLQHVEGWRESDGHYCNLMSPRFTHLAVGEYTDQRGMSFATQNFFSLG
jgi:uncharacterized protein YkwD